MKVKIVVVGSTGKLGTKLLNYTHQNSIPIYCITCFQNYKKLYAQKYKFRVNKAYVTSKTNEEKIFLKF